MEFDTTITSPKLMAQGRHRRQQILEFIENHPRSTAAEIAKGTGCSRNRIVDQYLRPLAIDQLIHSVEDESNTKKRLWVTGARQKRTNF